MKKNKPHGLHTPNWYCKLLGWLDGKRGNFISTQTQCISSFGEKKKSQFQRYASIELKHLELRTASKRAEASQILSKLRVNPMLKKSMTDSTCDEDRRNFLECQAFFQTLHSLQDAIRTNQIQMQQTLFGVGARYRSKLISYFVGMHKANSAINEVIPNEMYFEEHPAWRIYVKNNDSIDQEISQFLISHETI